MALLVAVAAAFAPACGKKGPPLPPLLKVPVAPEPFVARRLGAVVYLQVRIPAANTDKTSPADLERVFQPFQRLETSRNRETGGTGLGLSIARDILRAHGGDVTLANRPSGGAKAVVTLPV